MKVKLLVSRAGIGFAQSAGDVIEVGDGEAERMIAAGQAVPATGAGPKTTKKRRTATKKPDESRAEEGGADALADQDPTD